LKRTEGLPDCPAFLAPEVSVETLGGPALKVQTGLMAHEEMSAQSGSGVKPGLSPTFPKGW